MDKIITIGDKTFRTGNIKEYGISYEKRTFQRIYLDKRKGSGKESVSFRQFLGIDDNYSPTDYYVEVGVNVIPSYNNRFSYSVNRCIAVDQNQYKRYYADLHCLPEKLDGKRIVYSSNHEQKVFDEYDEKRIFISIKCKYLYITTYQNDNTKFYQSINGKHLFATEYADVEEIKKTIDEAFSESSKTNEDPYKEIEKLKKLLDMGAITKEEFDEKKKELLSKI